MPKKIAVSGKGGVGKTTVAGILARLLGKEGKKVLVIDADPDSNLASAIGVPREKREGIIPLSHMFDLIEERTGARPGQSFGGMFSLNPKVDDLVDRYGIEGEDGVKLLVLGTISSGGGGCFCPENSLLRALMRHVLFEKEQFVIMDMEAGIEHLGRGTAKHVDVLIVVVEPGLRSVETAARIRALAKDIGLEKIVAVLNKVSGVEEEELIRKELEKTGIPLVAVLPYNKGVVTSDLEGISPLDREENRDVVSGVEELKNYLSA
ncbi:MAG: AAA family ATPase [Thermoplasmata archaeon]|nr:MAG: AAA family ATPase [Thermoplasmata archaeon]